MNSSKGIKERKEKEDFHYEPTAFEYHLLFHLLYSFCTTFFHSVKWFMRTSYFTPLRRKSRSILYKSSQSHGGEHPPLFSVTLEQIVR